MTGSECLTCCFRMTDSLTRSLPPVVFVQRGRSFYFPTVVTQAVRRCRSSAVVVIADLDPRPLLPSDVSRLVHWWPIEGLEGAAAEFRKSYVHLSVNRPWLEMFCFERWFMIREFCRQEHQHSVVYLDSDVLVECDAPKVLCERGTSAVMFSRATSPHVTCFRDTVYLERLCESMLDAYRTPDKLAELKAVYQAIIDRGQFGSISDMFFFGRLAEELGTDYGDTFEVRNGGFFDHTMARSEGYRSRLGVKVVRHRGALASCQSLTSQEWVPVHALHCQGVSKIWLAWHADITNAADLVRSLGLAFWGGASYCSRLHRYLGRQLLSLWRRRNARQHR